MFISFFKTSLYTNPRKVGIKDNQCWKWFKPLALFERTRLAQCVLLSPDCHLTENKSSNQNQVFFSPAHKDIGQEISVNYIFKLFANIWMFWRFLPFSRVACFVFVTVILWGVITIFQRSLFANSANVHREIVPIWRDTKMLPADASVEVGRPEGGNCNCFENCSDTCLNCPWAKCASSIKSLK